MFLFYLFIFLVAIIALGAGSGMAARSFLKLARITGMNEYIVSFAVLGILTSIPEMFIAAMSALAGIPLLSVGNIIGANLANATLALGLLAILSGGLSLSRQTSKRVFWLSLLMALMPSFLVFGGGISKSDGLLLLILFFAYLIVFARDAEFLKKTIPHLPYRADYFREAYTSLVGLFVGLLILMLSSIFIVFFTGSLAGYLSADLALFGIVFLGLVTTLPELFFGIRGAILLHPSLAMGNILASTVLNSTLIVGVLSLLSSATIKSPASGLFSYSAAFTVAAFIFLSIFSYTGFKINRLEGVFMVSLYFLFLLTTLLF